MRRKSLVRAVIGLSLVLPSIATLVSAAPASAAAGNDACRKLVANGRTLAGVVSGCPVADTGGSGRLSHFKPSGGSIVWHNGTTTDFSTSFTTTEGEPDGAFPCPAGNLEFELKGTVTASTNSSIAQGATVAMEVCSNTTTSALTNEPHTTVKFSS